MSTIYICIYALSISNESSKSVQILTSMFRQDNTLTLPYPKRTITIVRDFFTCLRGLYRHAICMHVFLFDPKPNPKVCDP